MSVKNEIVVGRRNSSFRMMHLLLLLSYHGMDKNSVGTYLLAYYLILVIVSYLFVSYTPLSGFHGVLSGLLVGIKQIIPEQELGLLRIKAKVTYALSFL